jgi:hypothetical protein
MDLGIYKLDPAEKANNYTSQEVIFAILRSESQSFERYNFPVRFTEGQRTTMAGTYPTQNLVDAFQTLNGYDITLGANGWQTSDPDFDITKPYEAATRASPAPSSPTEWLSRVPRSRRSWAARTTPPPAVIWVPRPVYYLRRYIQESTSFTPENTVTNKHQWIVYRYAETL